MTNSGYEMQLAEKDDRIAELKRKLAAEQAKNVELREALESAVDTIEWMDGCASPADDEVEKAIAAGNNALAIQPDTSALETVVKKAGEVMRERCRLSASSNDFYVFSEAIRAIPGVTLEDLK